MKTLLAIDPGVNVLGVALFVNGELWDCGLFPVDSPLRHADTIVIELPQIYRATRSKAPPEDILQLAFTVGKLAERFGQSVVLVRPREWKGTIPKEKHHPRILDKLSDAERARIPKLSKSLLHNVIDAIGLGQYFLKKKLAKV